MLFFFSFLFSLLLCPILCISHIFTFNPTHEVGTVRQSYFTDEKTEGSAVKCFAQRSPSKKWSNRGG